MSRIDVLDEYDVESIVRSFLTKNLSLDVGDGFLHLTLSYDSWESGYPIASIPLSDLKEALNDTPS